MNTGYTGTDFYCDEVLSGRTPVNLVALTETALAFFHTRPYWPVHIVVVSRSHVASLLDASPSLLSEMLALVQRIAADVVAEHGACRVVTNLGDYQESKHLHWHIGSGQPLQLLSDPPRA